MRNLNLFKDPEDVRDYPFLARIVKSEPVASVQGH